MSEFKGTPGPWLRDGRTVYALQDSTSRFVDKENRFSAGFYSGNGCSESEVIANATLAEAAPELLECCLRIQALLRQAGVESKAGSLNPVEDNAAQIDAAIAKALGQ